MKFLMMRHPASGEFRHHQEQVFAPLVLGISHTLRSIPMNGLVYLGPREVRIHNVPDAAVEKETDALVRITTTNICGSDLHMYEGRTSVEKGKVLGHENLGQVIAVGMAVDRVKVGDWVCLPFNIACGFCKNCERGLTSACLTCNPGSAGAAYGYAEMGPYQGGQAGLLRVPYADFNCLVLPPDAEDKQNDYVMLSDIWPTGWHATELAKVQAGDSVVIYGAGPVGLFAAYSAGLKGASQVMTVDRHPDRLKLAERIGAIPIDDSKVDPVDAVMKLTNGEGADEGCECVGLQCHDPAGHEVPNDTMNKLVHSVRPTGTLGVVGVFVPEDPKPADKLMKKGELAFDFGMFFHKGLQMGTGQAPVKAYNRQLCRLIAAGKAKPSFLISHELPLDKAPDAYGHFGARHKGWTKVVLKPAA
jgi:glutathione-independent formaldehyde dehydrogenase